MKKLVYRYKLEIAVDPLDANPADYTEQIKEATENIPGDCTVQLVGAGMRQVKES